MGEEFVLTIQYMNNLTSDPLASLSVRIATATNYLGSGFIIVTKNSDKSYVLTARHCLKDVSNDEPILIHFYNYDQRVFFSAVTVTEKLFFQDEDPKLYDIGILLLPKTSLPVAVPECSFVSSIPKHNDFIFRGFPQGHQSEKPEQMQVTFSFPSGRTAQFDSQKRAEDNRSEALANAKGFSGSGLVQLRQDQVVLSGIITHHDSKFNTYTACDLSRINELLSQHELTTLTFIEPKTTNNEAEPIETSLIVRNREALKQAEVLWKNLEPKQSQILIESVIDSVNDSNLPASDRNLLLAKAFYLKALIDSDLGTSETVSSLLINAYNLHKEKKEYRERAALSYLQEGDSTQAYALAGGLLAEEEENPRAWLVLSQLRPDLPIPARAANSPVFKVGQVGYLVKSEQGTKISDLVPVFLTELSEQPRPTKLDRLNIYYWDYLAQTAMHHAFKESGQLINLEKPRELIGNPLLMYARDLLSMICSRVQGTDFQEQQLFRIARFDYCFCQYFLTDDSKDEEQLTKDLYDLFIGEQKSDHPSFLKGRTPVFDSIPDRLLDILAIFLQQQKPQLIINAVGKIPDSELIEAQILLGKAYAMLEETDEMVNAYRQYLNEVVQIDQHTTANCLEITRSLLMAGQSSDDILSWLTEGKVFTPGYLQQLLEAFAESMQATYSSKAKKNADVVKIHWAELEPPLQKALAAVYSDLKEWNTAKELWRKLVGEGTRETDELLLYLLTLFDEHRELDELSARLVYWRKHFTPNLLLVQREATLYRRLNNYTQLDEVAQYGMQHFPGHIQFWVDRLRALHRLGDIESLLPLLDDRLLEAKLSADVRMSIAHIYLVHNRSDIGQEVCYQVLKENWANPTIKLAYFSLSTHYKSIYEKPFPDTVKENMVVRFSGDGQRQILELTAEEIRHNPIARHMIGLQVNDSFQHEKTITNQKITYFIEQILDKYQGQSALIDEEIKQKPHSMPVQAITVPNSEDPNLLLEQMNESFGPQEVKRQLLIEEIQREFATHKIGFVELAQSAFGGDPVATWEYVTSNYADGFPSYPLVLLNRRPLPGNFTQETEFVLDFSSLLTLHYLAGLGLFKPIDKPFVVSQYVVDFVNFSLEQATNDQTSGVSLRYWGGRFVPYFYPEDFQDRRIKFWSSLRDWVQQNCRPDYAWERLEWEWNRSKSDTDFIFSDQKMFISSFWDTLLLAKRQNRLLVSDDLFVYTKLPPDYVNAFTTESYLRKKVPTQYNDQLWLALIRLNLRGITLTGDQLYQTYSGNHLVTEVAADYQKALHSFAPRYNPSVNNLFSVITFLRNLYADNLPIDYKRRLSRTVLQIAFTGAGTISEKILDQLLQRIDKNFELLGNYGNFVKEDLYHVLEIIATANQHK